MVRLAQGYINHAANEEAQQAGGASMTAPEKNIDIPSILTRPGMSPDTAERTHLLPKWARGLIYSMSLEIEDLKRKLERMERASAILDGMDYFTLNASRAADDREVRPFYTTSDNRIVLVATCGPDDTILIGRKEAKRDV